MEQSKSNKSIGEILSALTIAVLFLVILLLVVFAAKSYQHGADSQHENDTQRIVCAYIAVLATRVKRLSRNLFKCFIVW